MNPIAQILGHMTRPAAATQVRGLAILCLAVGGLALYTAAFPSAAEAAPVRSLVDGGLALAGGALCWTLASRFRVWMLHVAVVAVVASGTLALFGAATPVAAMLAITTLMWACVYVGAVCEPAAARLHGVALAVGPGAALLTSDVTGVATLWLPVGATFVATVEFLSRLTTGLRRQAVTDPLTGLHNRNGFVEATERAISTCRRTGVPLTLVQIDLDGFKAVNDRDGHLEGDRLLRLCADAWRSQIRAGDVLARLGGDEFVLMLPATDRATATVLLERLRERTPIRWSYGVAELEPGDDIETCLARADVELYAAKAVRRRPACQPIALQPRLALAG